MRAKELGALGFQVYDRYTLYQYMYNTIDVYMYINNVCIMYMYKTIL